MQVRVEAEAEVEEVAVAAGAAGAEEAEAEAVALAAGPSLLPPTQTIKALILDWQQLSQGRDALCFFLGLRDASWQQTGPCTLNNLDHGSCVY